MPAIVVEKPKMSRPMWNALKVHISRERQRKKLEQEADAEVERQRREREDQQKEQEMTLEETKEQVAQSELRLAQLKEDKHQLFLQLKKVLHEDDTRRKIKESNFNEMVLLHGCSSGGSFYQPITTHGANLYMPNVATTRPVFSSSKEESLVNMQNPLPSHSIYNQPILPTATSLGNNVIAAQKRSRTPSPPPQHYHQNYKAPSLSPYNSKNVGGLYAHGSHANPSSIFYTHSASGTQTSTVGYPLQTGTMYNYSSASSSRTPYTSTPLASKEEALQSKHHTPHYPNLSSSVAPRGFHQPMDQLVGKLPTGFAPNDQDKYFMSPQGNTPSNQGMICSSSSNSGLRSHVGGLLTTVPVSSGSHPSGIPIQQQNHSKSGSIITGNPLRPPISTITYQNTSSSTHIPTPRVSNSQTVCQPQHTSSSRYYNSLS